MNNQHNHPRPRSNALTRWASALVLMLSAMACSLFLLLATAEHYQSFHASSLLAKIPISNAPGLILAGLLELCALILAFGYVPKRRWTRDKISAALLGLICSIAIFSGAMAASRPVLAQLEINDRLALLDDQQRQIAQEFAFFGGNGHGMNAARRSIEASRVRKELRTLATTKAKGRVQGMLELAGALAVFLVVQACALFFANLAGQSLRKRPDHRSRSAQARSRQRPANSQNRQRSEQQQKIKPLYPVEKDNKVKVWINPKLAQKTGRGAR